MELTPNGSSIRTRNGANNSPTAAVLATTTISRPRKNVKICAFRRRMKFLCAKNLCRKVPAREITKDGISIQRLENARISPTPAAEETIIDSSPNPSANRRASIKLYWQKRTEFVPCTYSAEVARKERTKLWPDGDTACASVVASLSITQARTSESQASRKKSRCICNARFLEVFDGTK